MTGAADPLDRFQQEVLAVLHAGGHPATVTARLTDGAPDAELAAWVADWDPDLVALASVLVQTWAVREEPS